MAHNYVALWDTGATASVINQRVVDDLGLQPIGMTQVHGVNGVCDSEIYLVAFELPNSIRLPVMQVTKGNLGQLDVLIGMDVIALGDFSVTNRGGNTVFSFRMPGMVHTDYVEEHRAATEREAVRLQREAANQKIEAARLAKAAAKQNRRSA
jgi:predicted aspartyl protease